MWLLTKRVRFSRPKTMATKISQRGLGIPDPPPLFWKYSYKIPIYFFPNDHHSISIFIIITSPTIPCPRGRQMYSSYILQKIFLIVTTLAQLNAMIGGTKLQVSPAHPMDKWPKLTTHALWSGSWLPTSSTSRTTTTSKNYNNSNNSKQDRRNYDFLVALGTEPTSALWATYGHF